MKILFVTSEALPFAKTGGLGDVAGALPKALAAKRQSVAVIMPLYACISEKWMSDLRFVKYIYIPLAWRNLYCGLFTLKRNGITYYFVDNEYYFRRQELYGHFDDGERFAFFSKAVLSLIPELDAKPEVLHCNDWQTALVPMYLCQFKQNDPYYADMRTVFTIHNIEYQGRYHKNLLWDIFDLPLSFFNGGTVEFNGGMNLMKGAIECADAVTTVSPTYAKELQYPFFAHGLDGVIKSSAHKLTGILNRLDTEVFDPKTDKNLLKNYDADCLEDKLLNKRDLQRVLGLNQDDKIPVIGMVSRLARHKGLDLLAGVFDEIMELPLQFVLLGKGEWHYEHFFLEAQNNYPGRLSANIMVNFPLAMKIYAGADFFLMPSQTEPCGLAQMMAMRYGTLPIVRETGGLRDTVSAYNAETGEGNGFTFANYNAHDMAHVIRQAVELYQNKPAYLSLQKRCMETDFGWKDSAGKYVEIYRKLIKNK